MSNLGYQILLIVLVLSIVPPPDLVCYVILETRRSSLITVLASLLALAYGIMVSSQPYCYAASLHFAVLVIMAR